MKVIIGIGNPEPEYNETRHNVGKMVVDLLGELEGFSVVKSTGFMNETGAFVSKYLRKHNLSPQDIVIVHDDWAFDVGKFKLQINRNHNNHNGVRSIMGALGTKTFWRLRVGIGMNSSYAEPADYVLSKFSREEILAIREQIPAMQDRLKSILSQSIVKI